MATDTLPALTPRQRRVLGALHDYQRAHGYPPSIREVMGATGLTSVNAVAYQLGQLATKGYIQRTPDVPRGLRILHVPEEPREVFVVSVQDRPTYIFFGAVDGTILDRAEKLLGVEFWELAGVHMTLDGRMSGEFVSKSELMELLRGDASEVSGAA